MKKSRLEPIRKLTGKKSEIVKLEAWRRSLEKPYRDSVPVIEILLHISSSQFRSYQWRVSPTLKSVAMATLEKQQRSEQERGGK